jgi:hypothetical protein
MVWGMVWGTRAHLAKGALLPRLVVPNGDRDNNRTLKPKHCDVQRVFAKYEP